MKKIAILGAGTVGGSCAQILLRDAAVLEKNAGEALELAYVVDLRDMPDAPFHDKMVKDFAVVEADPEVFLVIEAIGGCGAALNFVRRSLEAGKHVVTSNKQLVAEHGTQLLALAKAHGVSFLFEASVGGGIPVLHPLSQCLGANEILEVRGILNGTTNFILTQMLEFGQSYDAALKDAQARGYAEQNPAADVDGIDAGRKICILADMMFGKNVDPTRVLMTGISTITAEDAAFAESAGMKLKLLGRAIRQGEQIAVFVSPHFVAGAQPLAPVSGVLNAIEVLGSNIGNAMFFGPGAGGNLDGFFYLNQSDYRAWQEEVRAGRKPIAMLFRPFPQGKLFKAIAEGMEQGWLDMPGLEAAYGIPLGEVWKPVLEQWERAGLVERDGAFIVLTLAGQFWQVNLSQLLLDYLKRALEA